MKKFLLTATIILSLLSPLSVFAQSTAACQQSLGSTFVWNGSICVNTANNIPGTPNASLTITPGTCPNGGQLVNGPNNLPVCNLGYTPLEPIQGITTGATGSAITFPALLGNLYSILFVVGALFSVLMLTISGIRYMLSEVVTSKERAIKRIQACLWALLLLAGSWLILNTINPNLLNFSLNPCPAGNCQVAPAPASTLSATAVAPQSIQASSLQQQQLNLVNNNMLLVNDANMAQSSAQINQFNAQCQGTSQQVSGTAVGGNANQTVFTCQSTTIVPSL